MTVLLSICLCWPPTPAESAEVAARYHAFVREHGEFRMPVPEPMPKPRPLSWAAMEQQALTARFLRRNTPIGRSDPE